MANNENKAADVNTKPAVECPQNRVTIVTLATRVKSHVYGPVGPVAPVPPVPPVTATAP